MTIERFLHIHLVVIDLNGKLAARSHIEVTSNQYPIYSVTAYGSKVSLSLPAISGSIRYQPRFNVI